MYQPEFLDGEGLQQYQARRGQRAAPNRNVWHDPFQNGVILDNDFMRQLQQPVPANDENNFVADPWFYDNRIGRDSRLPINEFQNDQYVLRERDITRNFTYRHIR